jgi:TRAP-type C4-dicarboxylate transport system substrate-binding protein
MPYARLLLSLVLFAGGAAAHAQPTTLRFAQLVPTTHPYHAGILVPWAAEVARATADRVKIEFTTAPLGPMSRNFDMVQQGTADLAGGNHALSAGRFQVTQIVQTIVGTDNPAAVSVAFWRTYEKYLHKANEHEGTHVLALHVSGSLNLFTTNREIKSAADIKGLKLLVPGPVIVQLASNLGAVPITRPVTEYYDAVSKGIVDGAFATNSAIGGFKVEPFIKHQVSIPDGYHFSSFFVVVNQAKWDALSSADRQAIDSVSGEKYAKLAGKVLGKQQDDILAARRAEARMKSLAAEGPLLEALRNGLVFFDKQWSEAAKAKGIDAEAALAFFREQARTYTP